MEMEFSITDWSLLENDWIIALCHIRGGSELGEEWHLGAKGELKVKSVQDIISCADFLIASGWTHSSLLAAKSSSAGAGLLASAMNFRPNLFKAVNLDVPFLDIRTLLLDEDLPLAIGDKDEFGDIVTDPMAFDVLTSYCPYWNLRNDTEYPAVLITAYEDDYRTPLWSILKYIKKFRENVAKSRRVEEFCDGNIVLDLGRGGHLGGGDNQESLKEQTLVNTFFEWIVEEKSLDVVGKKEKFTGP